jgi:hypothetical protein
MNDMTSIATDTISNKLHTLMENRDLAGYIATVANFATVQNKRD